MRSRIYVIDSKIKTVRRLIKKLLQRIPSLFLSNTLYSVDILDPLKLQAPRGFIILSDTLRFNTARKYLAKGISDCDTVVSNGASEKNVFTHRTARCLLFHRRIFRYNTNPQ